MNGGDLPSIPLSMRKASLWRRLDGIFLSDFEQRETGPDLLRAACQIGLEGRCRSAAIGRIDPVHAIAALARQHCPWSVLRINCRMT